MWTLLLTLECNNSRTLPDDTSGEFTFFGKKSAGDAQYLDFVAPADS